MAAVYPEVRADDSSRIRCCFGKRRIDDPRRFVAVALVDGNGRLDGIEIAPPAVDIDLGGPGPHNFGVDLDSFARLDKGGNGGWLRGFGSAASGDPAGAGCVFRAEGWGVAGMTGAYLGAARAVEGVARSECGWPRGRACFGGERGAIADFHSGNDRGAVDPNSPGR